MELSKSQTEWIDAARQMIDHLEQHPDLIPYGGLQCYPAVKADELPDRIAQLGSCDKTQYGDYVGATRSFGPHHVDVMVHHEDICERVVVGTRLTTKPDPDLVAELPLVTVEEDVVEWRCPDSFLAADEQRALRGTP